MGRALLWLTTAAVGLALVGPARPAAAKSCPRLCRPDIAACGTSCETGLRKQRRSCRRACRRELLRACRTVAEPSCKTPAPLGRRILVNGELLDAQALAIVEALEAQSGVRLPDGRYWYDPLVGLWGREGDGTSGLIAAGLNLGGSLRADASGGATGVFVNGRALHPTEVGYLSRCFAIPAGRYWLNAQGIAGVEGGPPLVDVVAACRAAASQHGPSSDPWYGSVIGDGNVVGAISATPASRAVPTAGACSEPGLDRQCAGAAGRGHARSRAATREHSRVQSVLHAGFTILVSPPRLLSSRSARRCGDALRSGDDLPLTPPRAAPGRVDASRAPRMLLAPPRAGSRPGGR